MENNENQWNSMKNKEIQWKSMKNQWNSMKSTEIQWNSKKRNGKTKFDENRWKFHDIQWFLRCERVGHGGLLMGDA